MSASKLPPKQSDWLDFNDAQSQFLIVPKSEKPLTPEALKQRLNCRLKEALYHLFPAGKIVQNTFVIGNIYGEPGDSLKIELSGSKTALWHDFATGDGGDILSLWGAVYGWDTRSRFPEIVSSVYEWLGKPQRPLPQRDSKREAEAEAEDLGVPTGKWDYEDAKGNLMACVYRYDTASGKQYLPWDVKTKQYKAPEPRPLYNQLGISCSARVVLVEGEKCAKALIDSSICATTAMNGANAPVDKTDWSPLFGKHVLIWPDHDLPGKDYAERVINKLKTLGKIASLALLAIPEEKPQSWDAADAVDEKLDIAAFLEPYAQKIELPAEVITTPNNCELPAFTVGQLLDDLSPLPQDLVTPRVLTPGGLLVFGGAPKVGKTDLLLSWLSHLAAGLPFLGMTPPRPLKIFYLQTEIMYDYLRERLSILTYPKVFDPNFLPLVRQNLVMTPQIRLLLDEGGVNKVYETVQRFFEQNQVDILVIDPLRNVYDPGKSGNENDNTAMLAFLQDRVEKLRYLVNPQAGVILTHHTKKITKKMVEEDPFQALSGAASLRSFYTTGMLLFRPDEKQAMRQIIFELRNGKSIVTKLVDKHEGRWQEMELPSERIVRKDYGEKQDAERKRCHDVILQLIFAESAKGNLYTPTQFSQAFDGAAGLGAERTIDRRLKVLMTKGFIKFNMNANITTCSNSKYGVMCVEGMEIPAGEETNPETGETIDVMKRVLPTHFKESQTGAILPVENPEVWVYLDDVW
jgi:putative DNA primase/helicase